MKFELEFLIKSSPKVLYNSFSTPSGLSEWFADDVNIQDDIFTFIWDGTEEKAKLLAKKQNVFMKFQWLETDDDKSFFELRIKVDPITREVALIVTDFTDDDEIEEAKLLWENQVNSLRHVLGC